jgi:outer membrane murein-binding lipoprotein Lpp
VQVPTTWIGLAGLLLSGGTVKIFIDIWREWRGTPTRKQRQVDANIKILASTRDELIEDNNRLRAELVDQHDRHEKDRMQWLADREQLRSDIVRLEKQIQEERRASAAREREAQERYDRLWDTVQQLRQRAEDTKEK